jgi:hypothetical protein
LIRTDSDPTVAADVEQSKAGLRTFNLVVGLIHLVQGIAMLWLSNDFSLPVTRSFLTGPPGTDPSSEPWFTVALGPAVALFLLLAAADHILMALPGINDWYNRMLAREENQARWIEYSVSSSLMIVLIAMICGINDIGALIAIFGANTAMIFFGMIQERYTNPSSGNVDWLPYLFGCFAGVVPWIVIAVSIWTSQDLGEGPPTFVYGIIISLFLLFNTFSVNMVLQYKRVGKWKSYVYGEKAYIVLSLAAKTALAWQVFANILIG